VVTEFSTPIEDTLRAIKLNFVETFEVPENQQINLLVYTDLDAEPVYQSGPRKVIYSPAGKYYRYTIDPVAVNGKFYVGYQQLEQQKTFVGYDVNYNNQQRTFLKQIGGTWFNSIFEGTLMLRADFSDGADAPLSDKSIVTESEVTPFYPNPARNQIRFNDINAKNIKIYNLSGVLVKEKEDITESLNLGGLSNGFYLVQVNNEAVQKLVIYR
jgi:hypothetical protein